MFAYSIPKSPKDASFISKNQNPGVGAYQTNSWTKVSRVRASPSSSIPKTRKFFDPMEKSQIKAGPGSYNPEKPQTKLFASIKSRKQISYQTEAPSPANYNAQPKFPTKKYSFARSNRKFKTEQGPGPASYTLDLKRDGNICSFGKQERGKINKEQVPGPGTYESQKNMQVSKGGLEQYSFPKQKKFITEEIEIASKSKIPGPGTYSINKFKEVFRGGKFTYGERMTILDKTEGPGPGFYRPKPVDEKNNPRAIIGSQKRVFYTNSSTPGPGSYEVTKSQVIKKKDRTVLFPHGVRMKTQFSQTPGPGYYDAKPLNESRSHSISSRHITEKKQKIPGPQDYKPEFKTVQKNQGHTIFGTESKISNQKNEVPGPGSYKTETKEQGRTYYFNKSKSKQKVDYNVGPGQYKIKPLIGMYNGIHKDNKDILYV